MYRYKFLTILFVTTTLSLGVVQSAEAAKMTRERAFINSAEANFLTNTGCEDVSVGVSVIEKNSVVNHTKLPLSRTLLVFGAFIDNCEFGTSTSFFGTTTVINNEFVQNGVDSATLVKTFVVDGHEIYIDLSWKGVGIIGGEDLKINDKGDVHIIKKWDVESRNAEMTGVFIVNGLNRISDNSLVNAQLEVVKTDSKTMIKIK